MTYKNFITGLPLLTGLLLTPLVFPQAETESKADTTESSAAESVSQDTGPGSQEVEYNDENYRRFMELKDQPTERNNLPTNSFQPGTQKLDKLPESSQKHLRNQLREIILEGDEWAPGDENKEYPYVASEGAKKDASLRQQEAEAWGELVGKYNEREAQIYANASRSESAAQADGGAPGAPQARANAAETDGEATAGDGLNAGESGAEDGQKRAGQEQQSATQRQSAVNPNEGSYSPDDTAAVSNSGVSQSALEYLTSNSELPDSGQQSPPPGTPTVPQPGQLVIISKDTLSIEDLQNAKGVTLSTGTGSSQATPIEIEVQGKVSPHEDGDG